MQASCKSPVRPLPAGEGPDRGWLDRLGIGVSLTCAAHCAGSAVLATAPALAAGAGAGVGDGLEWAEGLLLWAALGVGALALVPAYLRERRPLPLALFGTGVALLAASRTLDGALLEIAGTVAGVALVTAAHVVNLRSRANSRAHGHSH